MLYKNVSRKAWRRIIWRRRLLDMAARGMFLLKGEMRNVSAIVEACREFRSMKKYYIPLLRSGKDSCIYPRSLVFQYYFRRVRIFSRLWE